MNKIKEQLQNQCTLHWWNFGKKTLSFKGPLKDLLKQHHITFRKKRTEIPGLYNITFKSAHSLVWTKRISEYEFSFYAKQFLQMEMVRMGDKAQLYVDGVFFRPTVTVNF